MHDDRVSPEGTFKRPQDIDQDDILTFYISFGLDETKPSIIQEMLTLHETQPAYGSQVLSEACRQALDKNGAASRLFASMQIIQGASAPTTEDLWPR